MNKKKLKKQTEDEEEPEEIAEEKIRTGRLSSVSWWRDDRGRRQNHH